MGKTGYSASLYIERYCTPFFNMALWLIWKVMESHQGVLGSNTAWCKNFKTVCPGKFIDSLSTVYPNLLQICLDSTEGVYFLSYNAVSVLLPHQRLNYKGWKLSFIYHMKYEKIQWNTTMKYCYAMKYCYEMLWWNTAMKYYYSEILLWNTVGVTLKYSMNYFLKSGLNYIEMKYIEIPLECWYTKELHF